MNTRFRQLLVTGVAGAALVVATGCSSDNSDTAEPAWSTSISMTEVESKYSLGKETFEEMSAQQLAKNPDYPPPIRCDGGLEGEVGFTQACEVQVGDQWHPFTATVVSVIDGQINWRITADNPDAIPQ